MHQPFKENCGERWNPCRVSIDPLMATVTITVNPPSSGIRLAQCRWDFPMSPLAQNCRWPVKVTSGKLLVFFHEKPKKEISMVSRRCESSMARKLAISVPTSPSAISHHLTAWMNCRHRHSYRYRGRQRYHRMCHQKPACQAWLSSLHS